MEIKIIHNQCLKFLRRDLRNDDMQALEQNITEVGLDTLLDKEFFDLLRRLGDHQLVLLVASLGASNAMQPAYFERWLAAYQYLGHMLSTTDAAAHCEAAGYTNRDFHTRLFQASVEKTLSPLESVPPVTVEDLDFGIDFLIDAHQPQRIVPLVKAWTKLDTSASPWLKACKKIVERQEMTYTRSLAAKMAATCPFYHPLWTGHSDCPRPRHLAKIFLETR